MNIHFFFKQTIIWFPILIYLLKYYDFVIYFLLSHTYNNFLKIYSVWNFIHTTSLPVLEWLTDLNFREQVLNYQTYPVLQVDSPNNSQCSVLCHKQYLTYVYMYLNILYVLDVILNQNLIHHYSPLVLSISSFNHPYDPSRRLKHL